MSLILLLFAPFDYRGPLWVNPWSQAEKSTDQILRNTRRSALITMTGCVRSSGPHIYISNKTEPNRLINKLLVTKPKFLRTLPLAYLFICESTGLDTTIRQLRILPNLENQIPLTCKTSYEAHTLAK